MILFFNNNPDHWNVNVLTILNKIFVVEFKLGEYFEKLNKTKKHHLKIYYILNKLDINSSPMNKRQKIHRVTYTCSQFIQFSASRSVAPWGIMCELFSSRSPLTLHTDSIINYFVVLPLALSYSNLWYVCSRRRIIQGLKTFQHQR